MYISSKSTTRSWWCHRIRKSMTSVSTIFGIFQRLRRWALAFTSCTNGRRGWFLSLWGRWPATSGTSTSGRRCWPFNHNRDYSFFITSASGWSWRVPLMPRPWRKWVRTHRWGRIGPTETSVKYENILKATVFSWKTFHEIIMNFVFVLFHEKKQWWQSISTFSVKLKFKGHFSYLFEDITGPRFGGNAGG